MKNIIFALCLLPALTFPGLILAATDEMTRELNGAAITYGHTSGRSYNVKPEEKMHLYRTQIVKAVRP